MFGKDRGLAGKDGGLDTESAQVIVLGAGPAANQAPGPPTGIRAGIPTRTGRPARARHPNSASRRTMSGVMCRPGMMCRSPPRQSQPPLLPQPHAPNPCLDFLPFPCYTTFSKYTTTQIAKAAGATNTDGLLDTRGSGGRNVYVRFYPKDGSRRHARNRRSPQAIHTGLLRHPHRPTTPSFPPMFATILT